MSRASDPGEGQAPEKRGPGAPEKPPEERQERRTVRMDEDRWRWCQSQGDASKYLRQLVDEDRKKKAKTARTH